MENSFMELAARRYSVRSFTGEPVARETIDEIIRAGYLAPTACNYQPQRVLVIQGAEALEKLRRCTKCHFNCPTALLVCYDKNECWQRKYDGKPSGDIDASIVATHMLLAAEALGVGATWVMHFIPQAMREEFHIPDNIEPVALLVMGYPAGDAKPFPGHFEFRPMDELIKYDSF